MSQYRKPMKCRQPGCTGLIAFLLGRYKSPGGPRAKVPTVWDSLSDEEKRIYIDGADLEFDSTRHLSHYRDCVSPDRFSKKK